MIKLISQWVNRFQPELHIYTDGSHKGKWGSWAYVVTKNNQVVHESFGRVRKTNSNRMEFQAAIEALAQVKEGCRVHMYSDSRILIKAVSSKQNRPTQNQDQLTVIDALTTNRRVQWHWVKAHAGHKYNERCDELCIRARSDA